MSEICAYCGNEFEPIRASAKFCSDACRIGYHRDKKSIRKLSKKASAAINDLHTLAIDYPQFQDVINEQLTSIRNQSAPLDTLRVWKCVTSDCGQTRYDAVKPDSKCSFCGQFSWKLSHNFNTEGMQTSWQTHSARDNALRCLWIVTIGYTIATIAIGCFTGRLLTSACTRKLSTG